MSCPPIKFTGQQNILSPAGKASPVGYSSPAGKTSPVKDKTSPLEEKWNETAVRKISRYVCR